ncbi:helix-turn-helix domain-containing protein [Lactobacillus sp. M0396]|nr:helix-turn-helix domain-containing protein [Lactobacillus sp. M0396]
MNRIKELRQLNKVSQGDLAKITGLTRQAIS